MSFKNKNRTRPIKRPAARQKRIMVQRRRLVALGLPEEKVAKLNSMQIRRLLRHPKKLTRLAG